MSARARRRLVRSGQSLVEFALISLLFFTMFFGIVEMGWFLFNYHEVNNAAREGARYAVVHGTMSQGITDPVAAAAYRIDATKLKAAVLSKVNLANADSLTVTADPVDLDKGLQPGSSVKVTVRYHYRPLVGFILGAPSISLAGKSTMIIHY